MAVLICVGLAGYTAAEIKAAGSTATALRGADYTSANLRKAAYSCSGRASEGAVSFIVNEEGGFGLGCGDIKACDVSCGRLRAEDGFCVKDVKSVVHDGRVECGRRVRGCRCVIFGSRVV